MHKRKHHAINTQTRHNNAPHIPTKARQRLSANALTRLANARDGLAKHSLRPSQTIPMPLANALSKHRSDYDGISSAHHTQTITMTLRNDKETFIMLWRLLERTRQVLRHRYKRFTARNVLKALYPILNEGRLAEHLSLTEFISEACSLSSLPGYSEMGRPSICPQDGRELLRAITALSLKIGIRRVNTKDLDSAYSVVFPYSAKINILHEKETREQ